MILSGEIEILDCNISSQLVSLLKDSAFFPSSLFVLECFGCTIVGKVLQFETGNWNLSELKFVRLHFYSKLEFVRIGILSEMVIVRIPILIVSNTDKCRF